MLGDVFRVGGRPFSLVDAAVVGEDGRVWPSIRVEAGRIAALGEPPASRDAIVRCGGAIVLPGLINAHDHLDLNGFARLRWRERYANASEWIADFQPRFGADPDLVAPLRAPRLERLWMGGVKNLLSGVTTVAHHDPPHPALWRRDFPVRVVRRQRFSHSLSVDGEAAVAAEYARTPRDWPWIVHAGEGVDARAREEAATLERLGCLGPNTVVVHGVGFDERGRRRLLESGGALVWCPSSNLFLLGATAEIASLAGEGRVALGTDSRLSGARDLLEELRVAREASGLDAGALARMVLGDAAAVLRLPFAGRLVPGAPADLGVWPARGGAGESLAGAVRGDLLLSTIDGRPRVADPAMAAVFEASGVRASPVRVDGREKLLARFVERRLRRFSIGEPGLELSGARAASGRTDGCVGERGA